jgi:four helix bundle protein
LFAGELARRDVALLRTHPSLDDMPSQLARATRSISVNIAEGYSRLSKRDKGRYYEYALGSAREARDWYYKVTEELGPPTADQRLGMLTMIIRVLTKLASQCRPVVEERTGSDP